LKKDPKTTLFSKRKAFSRPGIPRSCPHKFLGYGASYFEEVEKEKSREITGLIVFNQFLNDIKMIQPSLNPQFRHESPKTSKGLLS